jgi:hypothetical protein
MGANLIHSGGFTLKRVDRIAVKDFPTLITRETDGN